MSREIETHWAAIAPVLQQLRELQEFSLGVPAVVVGAGSGITNTTVSDLPRVLKASAALSSEPMRLFVEKSAEIGPAEAFSWCCDQEWGEQFAADWDEAQEDIQRGARCSIDDVVEMVTTARRGFAETPRKLLVVVTRERNSDVTLVG
jgi:hypothetical protein